MVDIKNIKQLEKYINSHAGTAYVLNDPEIKKNLQSEMNRLQRYLTEEIVRHYNSFTPEYYHRTGAWIESIRVNPIKRDGVGWSISLTFDDDMAYHPSVVPGGEDGYVPWLMEVGWKDRNYETPHFDGFKGTHYIKNAVERWNKNNRFGFTISVYRGNERYL